MMRVTETKVASSGRTVTIQAPKAPAVGFFDGDLSGILFCPGLIVDIPRGKDIVVAVIDTQAKSSRLRVEKHELNVEGATLSLEAEGELRYELSVHDPSDAGEFRVEIERRRENLKALRVLASSDEGLHESGAWTPAKPSKRRVIVGHSSPFWVEEGRFEEALENSEPEKRKSKVKLLVIGDPAPDTDYRIRLVANRGWMKKDQVDETSIYFK